MENPTNYLNTPNRQSPVAILLILLRFIRIIIRQAWPIFLVIIFNPKSQENNWLATVSIAIAGISAVLSIIAYFKFYFYVQNDELIIEKGVIQKSKLNVPLDRIQTVNFKQNIIHQLFNVVSIELDTAGSRGNEFSITALSLDRAEAIRQFLLSKKTESGIESGKEEFEELPKEELLLELSPQDLIKVGVSQNHLRTVTLIIGSLFGMYQYLESALGDQIINWIRDFLGLGFESILWTLLLLTPLLLISAILISLVNTMLRYFSLRFLQTDQGFKVIAGLFTRKERSANMQKIQMVQWSKNPIKQLFKLYDIRLSQASSSVLSKSQSIYVPGGYLPQVNAVREAYLPGESNIAFSTHHISKLVIYRRLLFLGILPAIVITIFSILYSGVSNWIWAVLWIVIIAISSYYYQKNWIYEISPVALRTYHGILRKQATLLQWYKIQSVKTRQSLYQRRKGLVDIYFYTAAGTVHIPYIEIGKAKEIQDFVLFKIESDKRPWM